jgi:hypothetical protein
MTVQELNFQETLKLGSNINLYRSQVVPMTLNSFLRSLFLD